MSAHPPVFCQDQDQDQDQNQDQDQDDYDDDDKMMMMTRMIILIISRHIHLRKMIHTQYWQNRKGVLQESWWKKNQEKETFEEVCPRTRC